MQSFEALNLDDRGYTYPATLLPWAKEDGWHMAKISDVQGDRTIPLPDLIIRFCIQTDKKKLEEDRHDHHLPISHNVDMKKKADVS